MANTASIDPALERTHPVVELRVRAEPGQLPVLRAVAAAIAIQQGFDLDAVADVKLAIDEAGTRLITRAPEGATLSCRFQAMPPALRISASALTVDGGLTAGSRTFGWHVLNALADSVDVKVDETDEGSVTTIDVSLTDSSAVL
ncbi:ATP-binding protein [Rhodococcus ruber]|uniref:ATP-binding protein n=1 Tax=Rhodococcus ruber TaxID=1830 RepID=UPI001F2B341F|nr:ATP-binding protein [Rhodococcus ruber]MCF8781570.1 ATP-binding protein [Rhodococcus ruber]